MSDVLASQPVTDSKSASVLAPGLAGIRHNLLPGLVLQACALCVVLGYAFVPSFHDFLAEVGALKVRYGYAYAALSSATFGGVIPFLVLYATRNCATKKPGYEFLFYVVFWLWKGIEIDGLYRLQSVVFGSAATPSTIALKTVVDQFVYNPVWAAPTQLVLFLWKDCHFSWREVAVRLRREPLRRRLVVILAPTWIVWIPTVAIIYSLPSPLQVPLSNLALCFWCLILSFVVRTTS